MSNIRDFINKYLAPYLSECRIQTPWITQKKIFFPPTSEELEELFSYLMSNNVDPVILGSIAVIKYMHVTPEDIHARTYRLTNRLDLFVAKNPPAPLPGWQLDRRILQPTAWISPTEGTVVFWRTEDFIRDEKYIIGKDPESVDMGCSVADVPTLLIMNLNSDHDRDLLDVLLLANRVGIPKDLSKHLSTSTQRKNLEFVSRWIKMRQKRNTTP